MSESTTAARPLWNWPEYSAELIGTLLLVFGGLSAVVIDFGAGSPVALLLPSSSQRLLLTGLLFSGTGSLIALSPLGKRSGAHINPAVSLGFWMHGKMHFRDCAAYIVAQFVGAFLGAQMLAAVWRGHAGSVHYGVTMPGTPTYTVAEAFFAEMALTCTLVLAIFLFVSSRRLMRWTPLMNWVLVGTMVWLEAPVSGTSLNPARSIGPALVASTWQNQWLYCIAPPLGAALAVLLYRSIMQGRRDLLTGKLFHSIHYPSLFKNVAAPHSRSHSK
jgi:aquaporin Z